MSETVQVTKALGNYHDLMKRQADILLETLIELHIPEQAVEKIFWKLSGYQEALEDIGVLDTDVRKQIVTEYRNSIIDELIPQISEAETNEMIRRVREEMARKTEDET